MYYRRPVGAAAAAGPVLPNRSVVAMEQVVSETVRDLREPPDDLVASAATLAAEIARLEAQNGRHTIRSLRDATREQARLREELAEYRNGTRSEEYRVDAAKYLRKMRQLKHDTAATGSISESLLNLSQDQVRPRSHDRIPAITPPPSTRCTRGTGDAPTSTGRFA